MPTHDELVAAARGLVPVIRDAARSAERARRPDDGVIARARADGLFTMMAPACYGGSELDLDTFFEVGLVLGEADASHGWVIDFYIEHVWMFTQFPESFQRELFSERCDVLAPGILAPTGRAERTSGGYRLSGRFPWGTGIVHAEWVIVGAISTGPDGLRPKFFALPVSDVGWEDTWDVDGMCATGSHDIVVEEQLIPDERSVDIVDMLNACAPGSQLHAGPLYSTPMAPILSFAAGLPVVGQARMAVAEFGRQLAGRFEPITRASQTERPARQMLVARADLDVRAAEALLRGVLAEVMEQRGAADEATRVRWAASIAHGVGMCRRAIEALCDAGGATAHHLDNRLQRARRDANTMACHTVFDLDERYRSHGRATLGLAPEAMWF